MASLSVEQKVQQHGYQRDETAQGAPNQVNLGGFAVSFEDLLQRVGARLEAVFNPADKSTGINLSDKKVDVGNDSRDKVSNRDDKSERSDNRKDDAPTERSRKASTDGRDTTTDRSADDVRAGAGNDNRTDQADSSSRDDTSDTAKTDKADSGNHEETAGKDKSADSTDDGDNNGKAADQNVDAGNTDSGKQADTVQSGAQQSQNVTQAAAVYAAGLIGKSGNENLKANAGDATQQVQKAVNVTDNAPAQVAAAAASNGKQATHNTPGRNNAAQNTAAKGGEQKADNAELKGDNRGVQAQAQQMSRIIGAENRVSINVNVANEQNQLSSKPSLIASSNLVLAQDATKGSQTGTGAQSGQQQGQNPQMLQQVQAAVQQQAQAGQQGTPQMGPQGGAGAGTLGANAASASVQAGTGGMQTTGVSEALNNTGQGANAAHQTQQTQQTRESAPQQQAQHMQRDSQQSGSVTEQISVKITKALQAGTDRISIQLKPAELGRVDVKLEMTHDGRVMTVVTAEKQDTLDLLRRDSSELQKALADAGLQSGDMQFNLKGQEKQTAEGDNADENGTGKLTDAEIDSRDEGVVMTAWESGIFANGRLDMRA